MKNNKKLSKKTIAIGAAVLAALILLLTLVIVFVNKKPKENEVSNTTTEFLETESSTEETTQEQVTQPETETKKVEETKNESVSKNNSKNQNTSSGNKNNSSSNKGQSQNKPASGGQNSNKTYHTAWGTRPHEFEEVGREFITKEINFVRHWDRYNNVWYDKTNAKTSGHGKPIYKGVYDHHTAPMYFGNGRWSNNGHYWSEYSSETGTDCNDKNYWGAELGYYWPGNWGDNGKEIQSPCTSDEAVIGYISEATSFTKIPLDEIYNNFKSYGLTDEQIAKIYEDPNNAPLINFSNKIAP